MISFNWWGSIFLFILIAVFYLWPVWVIAFGISIYLLVKSVKRKVKKNIKILVPINAVLLLLIIVSLSVYR